MSRGYVVGSSVEDTLRAAGKPLTLEEVQVLLPKRRRLFNAMRAAIQMGHVRSSIRERVPCPNQCASISCAECHGRKEVAIWQYEYIKPEDR